MAYFLWVQIITFMFMLHSMLHELLSFNQVIYLHYSRKTTVSSDGQEANIIPEEPLVASYLYGIRGQSYKVLKALSRGEVLIASHRINANTYPHARDLIFQEMQGIRFWTHADPNLLTGEIAPGTVFPNPVFKRLLSLKWIEPTTRLHWIPNMRYYGLTVEGQKHIDSTFSWWRSLSWMQRFKLLIAE